MIFQRIKELIARKLAQAGGTDGAREQDREKKLYLEAQALTQQGSYHGALQIMFGLLELAQGDYDRYSDPKLLEAVTYFKNQVGALYWLAGDYPRARGWLEQVFAVCPHVFGANHPSTLSCKSSLAKCCLDMGEYARALQLFEEVAAAPQVLGEDHPLTIVQRSNLASFYQTVGDYPRAAKIYEDCLARSRRTPNTSDPAAITLSNNLAMCYQDMGDFPRALSLLQEGLRRYERTLPSAHPDILRAKANLAECHRDAGNASEALRLYAEVDRVCRAELGERHPLTLGNLSNMGMFCCLQGDKTRALPLLEEAVEKRRRFYGEEHPKTLDCLGNLAVCYGKSGDYSRAMEQLAASLEAEPRMLQRMRLLPDALRRELQKQPDLALALALDLVFTHNRKTPEAVRNLYNYVLRRRLLDGELHALPQDVVLIERYPHLRELIEERQGLLADQVHLSLNDPIGRRQEIDEIGLRIEEIERNLLPQIPEITAANERFAVDWRAVAQSLQQDARLVEYVRYLRYDLYSDQVQEERYAAFVVAPGDEGALDVVDLGEALQIDLLIAAFQEGIAFDTGASAALTQSITRRTLKRVQAVGALVWAPLRPLLASAQKVIIAPEGAIGSLPFELLDTTKSIRYLTCGADAVSRGGRSDTRQHGEMRVIADPNFRYRPGLADPGESAWTASARDGTQAASIAAIDRMVAGRRGAQDSFRRLPGSRLEAIRIHEMTGVEPLLWNAATSQALAGQEPPAVLFISTHGLVMEELPLPTAEAGATPRQKRSAFDGNPMQQCGIALAGAKTYLETGQVLPEVGTGFCTAQDFTKYDLRGTRVILSCCNTAYGVHRQGQGMLGLRSALFYAGASTLILTLWEIDDLATGMFMEALCRRVLVENRPVDAALRDTKEWMRTLTMQQLRELPFWLDGEAQSILEGLREEPDGNSDASVETLLKALAELQARGDAETPFASPYFWAAFVCYGDPSPFGLSPSSPVLTTVSGKATVESSI